MMKLEFDHTALYRLRKKLDVSQKEMAGKLGWSEAQYRKKEGYDKKFYELPTLKHLNQICEAFDLDLSYFFVISGSESGNEEGSEVDSMREKISMLKDIIASQKQTIASQAKLIKRMEGKDEEDEDTLLRTAPKAR